MAKFGYFVLEEEGGGTSKTDRSTGKSQKYTGQGVVIKCGRCDRKAHRQL